MPCCGKKRANVQSTIPTHQALERRRFVWPVADTASRTTTSFEYFGGGALTVLGPATGNRYHFAGYGAKVAVDARDRFSVRAVPHLREIRNP